LVHGDADGLPGLAVDRYGSMIVIHADSRVVADEALLPLRAGLAGCRVAYIKIHPRSISRLGDQQRRQIAPEAPAWGEPVDSAVVLEGGLRYEVRPAVGLSVGLFLDMREVRQWVRSNAADRSVLNLFAYTCSLGVCATAGGASRVVNVDVSRKYLDWGKANYALNGFDADDRDFIYGDAFDWLGRFARRREQFDLVIVDPPSFSSTPFSVTRDYVRLVAAAASVVSDAGTLLAATNHAGTSERRFEDWLARGLAAAGRHGRVARRWHEPEPDFPVHGRPYLKVRALEVE
jgi:23S rRNA (cytosine1962-C5)-methyltransferase